MPTLWSDPKFHVLISLLIAFVLGGVIGYERQYRQRTAGLRTNVLVAVGAALPAKVMASLVFRLVQEANQDAH